jgi:hypothetical protein
MQKYSQWELITTLNEVLRNLNSAVTNNFKGFAFTVPSVMTLAETDETGWPTEYDDLIVEGALIALTAKDYATLETANQAWRQKVIALTSVINRNQLIVDAAANPLLMKLRTLINDLDQSKIGQFELTAYFNQAIRDLKSIATVFCPQLTFSIPANTEMVNGGTGWPTAFDDLLLKRATVLALPGDWGVKEQAYQVWKSEAVSLVKSNEDPKANWKVKGIFDPYFEEAET